MKRCLDSLLPQLTDQVEILVIDNGTHKVKTLVDLYSNIRYVSESNTGLSYARNKAIKEANGDWILYIDDDAKSDKNLLETTLLHCMVLLWPTKMVQTRIRQQLKKLCS